MFPKLFYLTFYIVLIRAILNFPPNPKGETESMGVPGDIPGMCLLALNSVYPLIFH